MIYRREIDGLRALAVLPVILFHAGFETFRGGFVGVDVFFVISGFLITTIILTEKVASTFSLIAFYERRARRILPALCVVLGACLAPAWFWMMPEKLDDFGKSLMSVMLFISNILFWRKSDYFGPTADEMPLLHTWSLAVEEQYYVVYPVAIMLFWFLGLRRLGMLLGLAAVTSLALSEWGWRYQPMANFFLAPMRAWELLIGGLVAFAIQIGWLNPAGTSSPLQRYAATTGLGLLLYAIFFFDTSTPIPGLPALVPTLGAALIIAFARPDTITGRLLASPPLVGIGLISYSAYLWHQPLFAFARIRSPNELSAGFFGMLGVVALALAYVTWKYVERPFRNKQVVSRRTIAKLAMVFSAGFIAIGLGLDRSNGAEFRYTQEQKDVLNLLKYPMHAQHYRIGDCHVSAQTPFARHCYADMLKHNNTVLVWGDSHAAGLQVGMFALLKEKPKAQLTSPGCPPLLDYQANDRNYCAGFNAGVLTLIKQGRSPIVVMHANWRRYAKDDRLLPALEHTLRTLRKAGVQVLLVGSVPQWRPSLPEIIAGRMFQYSIGLAELPRFLTSNRHEELARLDGAILAVAQRTGTEFFSMLDAFCEGNQCRALIDTEGRVALSSWDYGHLTLEGSLFAGTLLTEKIGRFTTWHNHSVGQAAHD